MEPEPGVRFWKLPVWKLQIQSCITWHWEASLFLCTSLSGEAEEELEHADLDRTNSASGIDYIEGQLKLGLQTKRFIRRENSWPTTKPRQNSKSVRAFANRYRRAEKVGGMYDEESRGNRVLERARLSPENQRLVLIGAAYDLRFDVIVESLCMSFPEHKAAPQVFGRDGTPLRLQGI